MVHNQFYKLCKRWKSDVDKNPDALKYLKKFDEGPEMEEAIKYIRQRTQLNDITVKDARLMYNICAFETAWSRVKDLSPWCRMFNKRAIKVMEFAADLKYYWIDGYGFDITHKQACPAIMDMMDRINPKSKYPAATFYFTHSGTILKVLAHLGLYKDSFQLTHLHFNKQRHWRTSAIDSFASSLTFVLYECDDSDPKVLVLHQERVVRLPGCPADKDLCDLHILQKVLKNSLEHCTFKEMCRLK